MALCYRKSGKKLHTVWVFLYPPKVTTARVYEYGLTFGLASGHQHVAQREAIKVFGVGVKVMSTRHLQRSGMVRPIYDMELTGVPAD